MTAGRSTVLYDEGCRMCAALARWLADRTDELVAAPIGSEVGAVLLRDLDPDRRYASVHVVDAAGRRHSGGASLPVLLAALPHGRLAGGLARRMPWATDVAYAIVARNRATISRLLALSRAWRRAPGPQHAAGRRRDARQAS